MCVHAHANVHVKGVCRNLKCNPPLENPGYRPDHRTCLLPNIVVYSQCCCLLPTVVVYLPLLFTVSDEHKFKDVSGLYFRFTADDGVDMGDKKKASGPKLVAMKRLREFIVRSILVCCHMTVM